MKMSILQQISIIYRQLLILPLSLLFLSYLFHRCYDSYFWYCLTPLRIFPPCSILNSSYRLLEKITYTRKPQQVSNVLDISYIGHNAPSLTLLYHSNYKTETIYVKIECNFTITTLITKQKLYM